MFESMMDDVPDDVKMEEIPLEIKEYEKTETQSGDTEIEVDDAEKLQNSAEEFEETQSDLYGYIRRDGAVCRASCEKWSGCQQYFRNFESQWILDRFDGCGGGKVEEVPGNPKMSEIRQNS